MKPHHAFSFVLLLLLAAAPARAQVSPFTAVLRTSLVPIDRWVDPDPKPIAPDGNFIATLASSRSGSTALIARVFSTVNGAQIGSPLVVPFASGVTPADVLVSTVFAPGKVIVLTTKRQLHTFSIGFALDGSPVISAPTVISAVLGPVTAGAGTVLGETPNADFPSSPYLGVGTTNGELLITTPNLAPTLLRVSATPIQDIGALREVGGFALGVVSGGRLYWVDPELEPFLPGLQSVVRGSFGDSRSTPLIDFSSEILARTSEPWVDPEPQPIITANGTRSVATLEIPATLAFGSTLPVIGVTLASTTVKQVVFSSLTATAADGSGIIYNRQFAFDTGVVGPLWTIGGATLQVQPATLALPGQSPWITAQIEVADQGAAAIALRTLAFSVDGVPGVIPCGFRPPTRLEDLDGDGNVDLEVRFHAALLRHLLRRTPSGPVLLRASWKNNDGTEGTASAELNVVRREHGPHR